MSPYLTLVLSPGKKKKEGGSTTGKRDGLCRKQAQYVLVMTMLGLCDSQREERNDSGGGGSNPAGRQGLVLELKPFQNVRHAVVASATSTDYRGPGAQSRQLRSRLINRLKFRYKISNKADCEIYVLYQQNNILYQLGPLSLSSAQILLCLLAHPERVIPKLKYGPTILSPPSF